MTKVGIAKGKAVDKRAATVALTHSLGAAVAEAAVTGKPGKADSPYAVVVDNQGVAYLRVAPTKFILNTGSRVDVVTMDAQTVQTRGLEVAAAASVLEAAKILLTPITNGVIISERAKKFLEQITADPVILAAEKEEEKDMLKAKKASKKSKNGAAAKKSVGKRAEFNNKEIKVLADKNPKREGSASFKRFALYKNGMTVGAFIEKGGTLGDVHYDVAHKFISVS